MTNRSHTSRRRPTRSRYSTRPFVTTIAILCVLTISAWGFERVVPVKTPSPSSKWTRAVHVQDEECRLVHHARDKCAFVRANCADEEAGIFSYLSLYYCRLPHAQPFAFTLLGLWLALLFSTIGIAASDFFCVNLSTISNLLGMSESMAGVTFLAFGNGSPDVFSTFAAMSTNSGNLAIGELMGAAGFITAVVAGSMALVRPFKVARRSFVRDVGFFIVAASFSMVFLWDGKLYLWECATMVGFYIFYVGFVTVWHWWLGRSKRRRDRLAAMRSHYILPGGEEEEIQEYHDDEGGYDDLNPTTPLRGVSTDDFLTLEQGDQGGALDLDENEEARERWLGELNSNMRLRRPQLGSRRNTHNPIRPSLVGALEFRAVLSSLNKSRNIQSIPINLRRYSDDPNFTTIQQQDALSVPGEGGHGPHLTPSHPNRQFGNRARAVSANDADGRLNPNETYRRPASSIDIEPSLSGLVQGGGSSAEAPTLPSRRPNDQLKSTLAVRSISSDRLAPPEPGTPLIIPDQTENPAPGVFKSPTLLTPKDSTTRLSPTIQGTPPLSPFPPYSDLPIPSSRTPSIRLPSRSASPDTFLPGVHSWESARLKKTPKWWPSKFVPAPGVLSSTLFPTLASWKEKGHWERFLGVIAAPSVFLLTITLPVVEVPKDDSSDNDPMSPSFSLPAPRFSDHNNRDSDAPALITISEPGSSSSNPEPAPLRGEPEINGLPTQNRPDIRLQIPVLDDNAVILQSPEQMPIDRSQALDPRPWNRWLVILQAFTAPLFIVTVIWANTEPEAPRALFRLVLYSSIFSLSLLGLLLFTTTPSRPPRWRAVLCFMGFAVSIAWISTIANEVVGVLKTLGVILNMSDAILGLTIFAVGNSLGDLVADITVARLGFPVMALSACFGGPMLNILLGIGLSGGYMTVKAGKHAKKKHPDRPSHFKPYHIDVSTTLVISGATLLGTLVGLLIFVPLRGWKMDRKIGWGLMAVWTLSTVSNVVVEVIGLSSGE